MSYSALNAIDESKITRLGFKAEPCNYVYGSPNGDRNCGTIYKVDDGTYNGIVKILEGNDAHSIQKGDKVFILPGHPLAAERIKSYLKKVGANITNNVNIATVIAGTEEFHKFIQWNDQAKFLHTMMHWSDGYSIVKNDPLVMNKTYSKLPKEVDQSLNTYISGPEARYIGDPNIQLLGEELCFLTPASVEVIYNVLSRKLKVVTASTIADEANSEAKLTDEYTYNSIYSMLNSNDTSNRKLGLSLLFHCDLRGEIRYTIWRLAEGFSNYVRYADKSKSKDHFLERTRWIEFSNMRKEDLLIDAKKNGYMSQKILDDLIPVLQEDHSSHVVKCTNEDFYYTEVLDNGDIMVRLLDKWKEVEFKAEKDESS
jgi:hypothetical protein